MSRKFYTLKYPHPSFMANKWDAREIYTQSIEALLQKEALDEHIYHNCVTFKNNRHHDPASEEDNCKVVQEYILEGVTLDIRFVLEIQEKQPQSVAERAEDVELIAPLFVRFRSGHVATALGDEGYEILKWEEVPPDEKDRRIAVAKLNLDPEQTERIKQAEIETAKATAQAEELRHNFDKLSRDIANTARAGKAAQDHLEKAREASRASLKDAIEHLNRFANEVDPRIVTATQLYVQPEYNTYAKVAAKMGVSKSTVSGWFKIFQDRTGYSLGIPKPGGNFSVRAQTEISRTSGNMRNGIRMTDMDSDNA